MFFNRKNIKCEECGSSVNKKFNFCPHCGCSLLDEAEEMDAFGMLGRTDNIQSAFAQFGINEKTISNLMQQMMQSLQNNLLKQETEIETMPNGIKITLGKKPVKQQRPEKQQAIQPSHEQLKLLSSLPRSSAKTKVRRMSDRVIYELEAPGISSVNDVFVSKLESGYEIKAIGKNKVYTNSLPINLPLRRYSFDDKNLSLEFGLQ